MPIPVKSINSEEQVLSPFSGLPADGENGPNESDPSLLFVQYGDAGLAYCSDRFRSLLVADPEEIKVEDIPASCSIEGAIILEVDAGWNGLNHYGFAPPLEHDATGPKSLETL
jgi:hypothetical protein